MTAVHFIVYVWDVTAARTFYRDVLQREPRLDVPGMVEFELDGGAILGLMPEAGIARLLGASLGGLPAPGMARAELYLVVADPGAAHERALAAGARELSPLGPRSWGPSVAYALAPDGTVLAFATPG